MAALDALYGLSRPLFFTLDPESVHDRAAVALGRISAHPHLLQLLGSQRLEFDPRLEVSAFRLSFPLPLGIAAGFDKNALLFPALLALGFGAVEVGTATPLPQTGNPKPRVFRLPDDQALINRMGFPNLGIEAVVNNLVRLRQPSRVVGCNIGPNKQAVEAGDAATDYGLAYRRVAPYCNYVAINVSSPNTPGLRDVQRATALREILAVINQERNRGPRKPVLLKISPDLDQDQYEAIVEIAVKYGIEGIVATNTTIERPDSLQSPDASEAGGLSGRPLAPQALQAIRWLSEIGAGRLAVVAAGGIFTGRDVLTAISAGATLAQTYTGFIYRGPAMPAQVQTEMLAIMDQIGIGSLSELRGTNTIL